MRQRIEAQPGDKVTERSCNGGCGHESKSASLHWEPRGKLRLPPDDKKRGHDNEHEGNRSTQYFVIRNVLLDRLDYEEIESDRRRDIGEFHVDDKQNAKP